MMEGGKETIRADYSLFRFDPETMLNHSQNHSESDGVNGDKDPTLEGPNT